MRDIMVRVFFFLLGFGFMVIGCSFIILYLNLMSRLVNAVTNKGYVYFDWNVDSNDAGGDGNNSNKIYNNVINGLSHNKINIIQKIIPHRH
jgi:hypothetical protein